MCTADDWDRRLAILLARTPQSIQSSIGWLRAPSRRPLRVLAGILFILASLLWFLPVLGIWMLPLGLALLVEDCPPCKVRLERFARWAERSWRDFRS